MDDSVYAITNLNGYITEMRATAAANISDNSENDDLDSYISLDQMIGLVKKQSIGVDEENRYLLNEDGNEKIFQETSIWIHNVALAKLAAQDLVECAWDTESNEMVFWYKEQPKADESKPKRKRKRKNS